VLLLVFIQYVGDLVSDSEVDRGSSSEPEEEVEEVVDFMEEEARQHQQMVADGTEEANAMVDHLHWGQGGTYPGDTLRIHCDFIINLSRHYPGDTC